MKITKRSIFSIIIAILIAVFLSLYQLPYYIYKPGEADPLNPIVSVEGGHSSEGEMHLVTVRGGPATPIQYLAAKFLPHQEVVPIEDVIPEGVDDEEYFQAQLLMMESSQQASIIVAYKAAEKQINIEYNGVYVVSVIDDMPASGILESGDVIVGVDGHAIKEADDLIQYIEGKQAGDSLSLDLIRDDQSLVKEVTLEQFDTEKEKVGIGIKLVTDRHVNVEPEVHFSSGNIGGPSAGLMFALEIYDQLTEEDLTKGLNIVGSGEIDYDGKVHRIGGIDKKVVAAHRKGCDIFFAANENGRKGSNYELAKKTAEQIGTDMEIVPVDTFDDALHYLQQLK
ncbi:MAG TPA: SepM family pheromone-processing serine protease [Cerasibacillus sp.]|uniref:SepM family pheromone-processing serine protease n=1 Tax=Cerasibacillus sp. TaxID=2498711 RepID=UPI002F400E05